MNGYRLLALDIDGTLLNRCGDLTRRVRDAVASAMRAGLHVTLATGRNLRAALPVAEALELTEPLVVSNGSLVIAPATGQVLLHRPLDPATAGEAVALLKAMGLAVCASRMSLTGPDLFYERPPSVRGAEIRLGRSPEQMREVPDLAGLASQMETLKVMAIAETGTAEACARELALLLADRCSVLVTPEAADRALLEISAPGTNKAVGLARLAALYGLHPSEIIAFGDNRNDLEMLQYAGLGVAMGNATDEVKAFAKAVAATNEEDGVAQFLEGHILRAAS